MRSLLLIDSIQAVKDLIQNTFRAKNKIGAVKEGKAKYKMPFETHTIFQAVPAVPQYNTVYTVMRAERRGWT